MPYVIIRSKTAGCFAGDLIHADLPVAVLSNARRLWYWEGAASLSQLAVTGTTKPKSCKFPLPVSRIIVGEVVEVIDCSPAARKSIEEVPPWTA